jgi:photosystem II stability/assembly factor-like uncharacterized protein
MRPIPRFSIRLLGLLTAALLAPVARGAELRNFEDAALHAVQFLKDGREGWAVGDEGVIWHTIDSGANWERQPTAVRASLRSLHFHDPYDGVGWVAGREELADGSSVGVVLYTKDGGVSWRRLLLNALPGLNQIRFVDANSGYLAGDGSEQFPTGVFMTKDGGRNWEPVPGPRCPSWLAADFCPTSGALAGAWNRLATVRNDKLFAIDEDPLGGRNLRGLQLRGKDAVAVGQGGLILFSRGTRGTTWGYVEDRALKLDREVRAAWDFHAVGGTGSHIWAVGRPGSLALHSPDLGQTWEVVRMGQTLPLNGLFFLDERRGWAVGEFGTVVSTADGGKTWRVQRRGGERAAVMFTHARATGVPLDTVALLGGQDGYLSVGLRITAPDRASAALPRATDGSRFQQALRLAGAAGGEMLWQFPISSHLARAVRADLLRNWDRLHGDRAAEQLLRQLVLAVRMWRPSVIITDHPDTSVSGYASDALVAEAMKEAFERAGDPAAFPEQIRVMGLEPWKPVKLYGRWDKSSGAHVTLDLAAVRSVLGKVEEFVAEPALILGEETGGMAKERNYRLLGDHVAGAAGHRDLMQGVSLAPGGLARRTLPAAAEPSAAAVKAAQQRATLRNMAELPASKLTDPDRLLSQIGPMLADMPVDQAAPTAYAVANQFVRAGQWTLARETFLLLVERYPTHPLAIEGYRWLVRHNSSSEARRRHELGQFLVVQQLSFSTTPDKKPAPPGIPITSPKDPDKADKENKPAGKEGKSKFAISIPEVPHSEAHLDRVKVPFGTTRNETRRWYQSSLDLEPRLASFGPLFHNDPAVQFCLQAARRNLGDFDTPRKWYTEFAARQTDGPWRSAAQAELWLANRVGPPPRPVLVCRATDVRPYLDGKLNDPCWEGVQPVRLSNAAGDTIKDYPTEVRTTYDKEFLYLAVRCGHPAGQEVPAAKVRTRDGNLRPNDRISLMLDLDRDYATYFHFQVDQTGCVAEDCWGDRTWNPRWFVAVHREPGVWVVEAAIPLGVLTGDLVTAGRVWAANVFVFVSGWCLD